MSAGPSRSRESVDYTLIEQQAGALLSGESDFIANAANFAAFVYGVLPDVNWAGFYFPDDQGLVLGPFAGKPACTRLPRGRGVCGKAFSTMQTVVVDDVAAFDDHIVCDSASRSEIVVPLLFGDAIFGVFDVDSPVLDRFNQGDRAHIERLVSRFVQLTPLPARYRTRVELQPGVNDRIDVQTCIDHHSILRYFIGAIARAENATALFELFQRMRAVLTAHLKLEDGWLYPRLEQSTNALVRSKAERYRNEMGDLHDRFTELWKTWSSADAIARDHHAFRREWNAFSRLLEQRIEREDHDLYPALTGDEETGAFVRDAGSAAPNGAHATQAFPR